MGDSDISMDSGNDNSKNMESDTGITRSTGYTGFAGDSWLGRGFAGDTDNGKDTAGDSVIGMYRVTDKGKNNESHTGIKCSTGNECYTCIAGDSWLGKGLAGDTDHGKDIAGDCDISMD